MTSDVHLLGRALIIVGLVLVAAGLWLLAGPALPWFGRLPGDIVIRRDPVSFYVPLTSCLLASALISVVLWLIGRFRH